MFKGGAGKLNRLITFQTLPDPSGPKNDFGELLAEPEDYIEDVRAAYEPVGGGEFREAEKRHAETTARFRIRYRSDLNVEDAPEKYRILYTEDYCASPKVIRIYNIQHAAVFGRRDELHFHVSEVR
jgi:head-tail adaptor